MSYFQAHYYTDSAPGAAFVAVPFYRIGQLLGDPEAWGLALTALLGGATVLLVYAISRKLGSAEASARFAGIAFGLGTLIWREAGRFAPTVFSLVLFGIALWLVLPPLPRTLTQPNYAGREKMDLPFGLLLGAVLGFAVVVDYPNAIWTPVFALYILWTHRAKLDGWLGLGLGWIAGLTPLLLYNWAIFGKPWAFTYGFLLSGGNATSLKGQFLNGFGVSETWQAVFGSGRNSLGLFVIFFGIWGLAAMWGQRGKRQPTILLIALIVAVLISGLVRRPFGEGMAMSDFIAPILLPLALGAAVWHERLLFLTRLEYRGLPALSTLGLAFYYFISPPGPGLHNLGGILPVLPLIVVVIGAVMFYQKIPPLQFRRGLAVAGISLLFIALVPAVLAGVARPAYAEGTGNNLLYNPNLQAENDKVAGWYGLKSGRVQGEAKFLPYLLPVQGGKVYGLRFEANAAATTGLTVGWVWSDEGHETLGNFEQSYNLSGTQTLSDSRAAPPAAAYLQLVFSQKAGDAIYRNFALYDDGVRLEPMKNYATAALSFSFDWESAMGGLIHSRGGGVSSLGESGGEALTEENRAKVIEYANERGIEMRNGADNLLRMFEKYGITGTFYATGYNLLDGNSGGQKFAGDPTYKWAKPPQWPNDYFSRNPWYSSDPYGTYQTYPGWYFGDQTDKLKQAGQEIASHTFGHLLVRAASPQELAEDLVEWVAAASEKKLPPARSFAFPWKGSNSLNPSFYDVLYNAGFRFITRTYDPDHGYVEDGTTGALAFISSERDASGKPLYTASPNPDNYYYYLDRIHYALTNRDTGKTERTTDSRFLQLHDYQLLPGQVSEQGAKGVIDELLRRRGGYGSVWTHPEAVTTPQDQSSWEAVIAYAAEMRGKGLWVDGVEAILQFRVDSQRVGVKTVYENNGKRLKITLTNPTPRPLDGLTLTLPAPISSVQGGAGFKGAQVVAPRLPSGGSLTLTVDLS